MKRLPAICVLTVCSLVVVATQTARQPSRAVTDPGVITTRQSITPAGVQSVFDGRVYGVTFGATAQEVWVLAATKEATPSLYQVNWRDNNVVHRWVLPGAAALQGLVLDPTTSTPLVGVTIPAKAANNRAGGAVQLLHHTAGTFTPLAADLGRYLAGAPALATTPRGATAIVPLVFDNAVAVVDGTSGAVRGTVKTNGVAPFAAVISRDGRAAWVSNWGGRWPKDGDITLPTGGAATADRVVVDSRGIASTGTVVRVDIDTLKVTSTIDVGLHPTALAWDEPRQRLYVANANTDSVSIIDTAKAALVETMPIRPFGLALKGVAPSAIVVSPNGERVYVALGGLNAVAVIDARTRAVRGFIPTAWYPDHLALSQDGTQLAIATLLGVGSGWQDAPNRRYVHSYRGTVNVLPVPDDAQLLAYSTAVAENNRIASARDQLAAAASALTAATAPQPVPSRPGDPSPIEHVVYI
ncbi:MAG: YncE family protein, partial [Acidobacteriota bacterium]